MPVYRSIKSGTIQTTIKGGDFRPIINDEAVRCLAEAFKRWVDAGKPDYIPAENESTKSCVQTRSREMRAT